MTSNKQAVNNANQVTYVFGKSCMQNLLVIVACCQQAAVSFHSDSQVDMYLWPQG